MYPILLALSLAITPAMKPTETQLLARYIVSVHEGAEPYAEELAERIIAESRFFGLSVSLFASVGYIESRYHMYQPGQNPRDYLGSLWQIYPDKDWRKISRKQRMELSIHVPLNTWRAATILAYHASRCGHTPRCYARYQSGNRNVSRGYVYELYRQAKVIRRVLHINPVR